MTDGLPTSNNEQHPETAKPGLFVLFPGFPREIPVHHGAPLTKTVGPVYDGPP